MPGDIFFDTNVLIYAIAEHDPRSARAEALLAKGGTISIQGLNEFASVARRKFGMQWSEIAEALDAILILCPSPISITLEIHRRAMEIAQNYRYGIYDAMMAAAALQAKCRTLYSEDLQDGQVIEEKLAIKNPFS